MIRGLEWVRRWGRVGGMARISILFGSVVLGLCGCGRQEPVVVAVPPPAVVEVDRSKEAVEEFRAEVLGVRDWLRERTKGAGGNPLALAGSLKGLGEKVKGIRTDKLPPELREAFGDLGEAFGDAGSVLKEVPTKPDEMLPFILKSAQDPEFLAKVQRLLVAGNAAAARLRETGKKYGIEDLDLQIGGGRASEEGGAK